MQPSRPVGPRRLFGGTGGLIRINGQTGARTTLSRNNAPPGAPTFVDPSGIAVEQAPIPVE